MKVLLGAAAATLLVLASAAAQTPNTTMAPSSTTTATVPTGPPAQSSCTGVLPPDPTLPDGNTAAAPAMQTGDAAYQAWATAAQAVLNCRRNEAQESMARAESLRTQFNALVEHFNATGNSWKASGDAYRAHHPTHTQQPHTQHNSGGMR